MTPLIFGRCLGACETVSPWMLPDGFAQSAVNVDLKSRGLMLPRAGSTDVGGPAGDIQNAYAIRSGGTEALWMFFDFLVGPAAASRYTTSGGYTTITLTDTPAFSGDITLPQGVASGYNNKVFLAYNSAVNRLHLWDGSAVRRVGIGLVAAATVANTGAGAYAATIRYYKVQQAILSGTTVLASSELSASVSFTPSGAGTAARVTKPTTIDSATHWRVYGSADGSTYYALNAYTVVATTTFDDSTAPASYNTLTGLVAPEVGLFVPPPSCKFLATNGERLFMAGAYETSASSGETTPTPRRVWFTRPLGVTDEGDDEAVTQSADSRYHLDIDNEDGSDITALLSTIDGAVYCGTSTSLWRLTDTGLEDEPVRAERVVAGVGPTSNALITATDTIDGSMVYFGAFDGPYRYSPSSGVQYLGADWVIPDAAVGSRNAPRLQACQFDPASRRVFWLFSDDDSNVHSAARVLDPALIRQDEGVARGGWSIHAWAYGSRRLFCAAVFEDRLHFGGAESAGAGLLFCEDPTVSTDSGAAYTATLTTADVFFDDGMGNVRTDDFYIWKRRNLSVAVSLARNRAGTGNTQTGTAASESIVGGETSWHRAKVENVAQADAASLALTLTIAAPVVTLASRHTDGVDRVVIPVFPQERG